MCEETNKCCKQPAEKAALNTTTTNNILSGRISYGSTTSGGYLTGASAPRMSVSKTVTVSGVPKVTVEEINRLRKALNVPKTATVSTSSQYPQHSFVTFTWDEGVCNE